MVQRTFKALVVTETPDGKFIRRVTERSANDLPPGEVLIRVHYSSLNYKDALSATGNKGVTKTYPHTPGVDAAGVVEESASPLFKNGEAVLVTGYDLGSNTDGGFAQCIRVPADWVVKLPTGLSLRESMVYGTAGFTAALSVYKLLNHGVEPGQGSVAITGATGGVGSMAVALLAKSGFHVAAVTGKMDAKQFLLDLGAREIIHRDEAKDASGKPMLGGRWAGAVDTVGGDLLTTIIRQTKTEGAVACCGNIDSTDLHVSIYPFILRGVSLIGIGSAFLPMRLRLEIWKRLASEWKLDNLERLATEVSLTDLDPYIDLILRGGVRGRVIVNLASVL